MFNKKITTDLLSKFRKLMQDKLIDAYLVPMGDAHNNEYIATCDEKIAFISGFTGSAGTAVITKTKAALWTDGRYFEQAENQIDNNWMLMKFGRPGTPTQADWLNKEIYCSGKVGMYKYQVTVDYFEQLKKSLLHHRSIEVLEECLVSAIWSDRPVRPSNPIIILPESFTGKSWRPKIDLVRMKLKEENVSGVFLSALDEIAWLFNLRGSDIPHNPVFFAFCFVTEKQIHLFVDRCKMDNSPGLCEYLFDHNNCMEDSYKVDFHPYNDVRTRMKNLTEGCAKVWLDPRTVYGLVCVLDESQRYLVRSPISLMKAVKSPEEVAGMKQCSILDSVALCQYFYWLEKELALGHVISEATGADELDRLRSKLPGFYSLSFSTISCSGPNASVIHYHPVHGLDGVITDKELYLCDSGGQYLTGTTDVTRTMHFGTASDEERRAYTLVLLGHVALASQVFPEGTAGSKLDPLARMHLWRHGMDYAHGTGHGVGAFLNVHEGPCGLSGARAQANEEGLRENMVMTIEPGYYEPRQYGIRIENDYVLTEAVFPGTRATGTKYLAFEPLTWFPIQTKLIDLTMVSGSDIAWINEYHDRCRLHLGDLLRARGLVDESRWLLRETEPIASI